MQESKEKIKSRMIKSLSRLWGFPDTEAENAFDPLVGMIIGAMAGELEKISGDIHDSESRVVERLVELLTPAPVTGPEPAHAIAHALPTQPSFVIYPEYQFYLYKKSKSIKDPSRTEEKTIYFTPAGSYKLVKGFVRFITSDQKIFEFQENQYKEPFAQARRGKTLGSNVIWLGLDLHEEVESVKGISFFFDLRSESQQDAFYQILTRSRWSMNGHSLPVSPGYSHGADRSRKEIDALLSQEFDVTAKVTIHVNQFYRKRFISVQNGNGHLPVKPLQGNLPVEFQDAFEQKDLDRISRNITWIRVEFPQPLPHELMDDIYCFINCFPVINRQLNDFTQASKEFLNIIPLQTEDSFFDMRRVINSNGEEYLMKAFSRVGEIEKGSYILRGGNVGRFDSRNAMEILNYLLELLRDESAAFTILGADMVSSSLRELNQIISRLEQRLQEVQISKENTAYLMLKALPKDEMVFVEYWSTSGTAANKIKAGTRLTIYEGSDLKQESIILLSPTVGGREKLETEERLNAYRQVLLSRGRVVTPEDVKALCFEHFGMSLEKVDVKKGLMQGQVSDQGFVRTIDVYLTFSQRNAILDEDELAFKIDDLKIKLEERSSNIFPYRILIE